MSRTIAQATDPRASNGADFQPPTQNPQTAPGQLFPQSGEVQPSTQESLLQNRDAEIRVTTNPAPAPPQQAEARPDNWSLPAAAILAVLVILLIVRYLRRPRPDRAVVAPESAPVPPLEVPATETKAAPVDRTITPAKKKPAPKKSKSKRKNRNRR